MFLRVLDESTRELCVHDATLQDSEGASWSAGPVLMEGSLPQRRLLEMEFSSEEQRRVGECLLARLAAWEALSPTATSKPDPDSIAELLDEAALANYEAGRSQMAAGDLHAAVKSFRRSGDIRPHHKTFELLGETLSRLGRNEEAVGPLAAATALNKQPRAPSILAEVFESLGDLGDARQFAELALERHAENRRAKAVLARIEPSGRWRTNRSSGRDE